jgi:UDP-N-acetylmuramate-alanine ligase
MYFEPHQAQRLLSLWKDFSEVVAMADTCYLLPIYHAREVFAHIEPLLFDVFAESIVTNFDALHTYIASKLQIELLTDTKSFDQSIDQYQEDSVIVIFSAGNLDGLIRKYLKIN